MSATTAIAPADTLDGRVTQRGVIRSEWTKLWSLRSTRYTLLGAVIAMLIGPIVAAVQMNRWASLPVQDRLHFDSIDAGVGGYHLAQLFIAVLGVLVISGEYSTGMIRSSMMAVPRRLPVLWAKLIVFCASTFALLAIATFIAFFAVQTIVSGHHLQHSLSDPHALRAVLGVPLFITVLGALGIALGTLVRNTAGGIATLVGFLFVLPGITGLFPASIADKISPYMPGNAAVTVATSTFDQGSHHLSPWGGFAVIALYTFAILTAAAVQLLRRDV